jgi:hypothetical protein
MIEAITAEEVERVGKRKALPSRKTVIANKVRRQIG